mmetsp:Transcript_28736/g.60671  ORF Transcript_28736/g.60671 Transcript_28736/m.60671 type:complete len:95 (+) Transcript_28736:1-285(+)
MIITASLAAEKRKSAEVEIQDIKRVYGLFVDVKRSTQYLMEYNKEFMFNELDDTAAYEDVVVGSNDNEGKEDENEKEGSASEDKGDSSAMKTSP